MHRAMPQRSRAWREAGRGAERAQRARCDICRGRCAAQQNRYSPERKLHTLDRLAWSEMFESFLANKYTAAKRFGLEVRARAGAAGPPDGR